jgi:peptide/nickel transport system substrate-binding protein
MDWSEAKRIARAVPTCIGTGSYSYYDVYVAFDSALAGIDMVDLGNSGMYRNPVTDDFINAMLAAPNEAEAIANAKKAQYDGTTGLTSIFPISGSSTSTIPILCGTAFRWGFSGYIRTATECRSFRI